MSRNKRVNAGEHRKSKTLKAAAAVLFALFILMSALPMAAFAEEAAPASAEIADADALQDAVNNAPNGVLTVLTLTQDIELNQSTNTLELIIPAGKVIALWGGHRLISGDYGYGNSNSENTAIDVYGTLTIDGITVTHNGEGNGNGIDVFSGGSLTLASGAISENGRRTFAKSGVHVQAGGAFTMTGGAIRNNAGSGLGTAVHNLGAFTMNGGEICNNESGAIYNEGGVFTMTGGEIYGHQNKGGSGVTSSGTFTMTGGKIYNNIGRSYGGGVSAHGVFNMSGGEIYNNHSYGDSWTTGGGGGVYLAPGATETVFTMTGGEIYGNSSTYVGGGIYARKNVTVALEGGEIHNNTALHGGGVFMEYRSSSLQSGDPIVSASLDVYANLTVGSDAVFYGNSAQAAYSRDPAADSVYESNIAGSQWSAPFTQGYNNYDINHMYDVPLVIYTVTFVDWDGTALKTQPVERGGDATAPANPTRDGYTFAGWDRGYTNVQSDITVTAQYIENPFTVNFLDWNGTNLKSELVTRGGNATAPANPTRYGYTFTGWNRGYTNVQASFNVIALYTANPPGGGVTPPPDETPPPVNEDAPVTPAAPPAATAAVEETAPAAPEPTPDTAPETLPDEETPTTNIINDTEIPLETGQTNLVWALINLLLAAVGLVLAIVTCVHALLRKRRENSGMEEPYPRRAGWLAAAILLSIAGAVVFILTQDMSRPMVLTDNWTIVNALILAAEFVGIGLSFRRRRDDDEQYEQYEV